ncbi:hypothetical protein Tco_1459008, partial [Tanacetum coccineum]
VLNGEVSCDKFVHNIYDGKSSKLYYTDPKEYPFSSMTQLLQVAVPDQPSTQMVTDNLMDFNLSNLNESFTEFQVNDNAGIDFDNTKNHSLEDMVRIGKEEIDEDELAYDIGEEGVNKSNFVEGEKFENKKIE